MTIETLTINDLRAKTSNTAAIYYTIDKGKEGEWYYDAVDTTSLDNIGTILVSTSGMRFKRVYDSGFVTATWFFDSSDPDATLGIQRALDFISPTNIANELSYKTGGGTVFLPKGVYSISQTLLIAQNCRLIGVNNRYHFVYPYNQTSGGTVIKANFSNKNNWVISSATYPIAPLPPAPQPPLVLIPFNISLSRAGGLNYSYDNYIFRMGISVENLTIDGGNTPAFGGIRLANAGNCTISNVGVHNTKCAFLLNTCWGGTIENCFTNFNWYGIIISNCNSFVVSNCYCRYNGDIIELIPNESIPDFIKIDVNGNLIPYSAWDLNDNVKYGKTGIFCIDSRSVSVNGSVVEYSTNAITIINSTAILTSIYVEGIKKYGITQGVAIDEIQLIINQLFSYNVGSLFFFGKSAVAKLNAIDCFYRPWLTFLENKLYETNLSTNRNITFTNVVFHKRKYMPDILFTDECNNGQNYGSVYIDPTDGNDDNYGFNKNDAVKSFDAALIRVQNQSTINPVKTIYIKAASSIGEGVHPWTEAAIKNLDKLTLENANILITSYDITNDKPRGRIYFQSIITDAEGTRIPIIGLGLIELKGNVNLYFRNVDIYSNDNTIDYLPNVNKTIFGLNQSYSKITFETSLINLEALYSIIKNCDVNYTLIESKFINSNIIGSGASSLSPNNGGAINMAVDNIQIGSSLSISIQTQPNTGWLDAQIIQNNF